MAATSVVRVEQVDPSHLPANTPGRVAAPLYVATSTRSYKRNTVEKKNNEVHNIQEGSQKENL